MIYCDPTHTLPGHSVIGTCSLCAGPVTVPTMWGAAAPPIPVCGACGATAAQEHPRVIPMVKPRG